MSFTIILYPSLNILYKNLMKCSIINLDNVHTNTVKVN